jgi:hypothetical protein
MGQTQVGGEQINRVWQIVGTIGLLIGASSVAYNLRPAYRATYPTGGTSWEARINGQTYQSGSLIINLGGASGTGVTADPGIALEVIGTASGRNLFASKSISGTHLYAATTFNGAGLGDCDTAATSKLLWDATTKRFSCGTDQTGGGAAFSTGNVLTINGSYVKKAGDTMTGTLVIANSKSLQVTGTISGTTLKILGTASGNIFHAEKSLTSSGTLAWEGAASGSSLYVATSFQGAGLVDCDLSTQTLAWDATSKRFSCGTDSDTTYTAGQGLTLTSTTFSLSTSISGSLLEFSTVSGATVVGTNSLRSSGSLVWEGTGSGKILNVTQSASFMWIPNCAFLVTGSAGALSCGTLPTRTVVLTAGGGLPATRTGSGASGPEVYTSDTVNDSSMYVLEYGNTSKPRYAMWTATMPDNYDGGTMTFTFRWKTAATSGDVKWFIQCRSLGDNEAISQSWGTAQSVTDTAGTANTVRITSATAAVTCAGTPAGGEVVQFRVYRDPADASDTLADTGALISVKGEYVTNSMSD